MPGNELLREAERVMVLCNACRYCEGFCAVFPAMELRRTFTDQDLKYLANLCHDCRGCYYACQYAPPHEFDLNVPKTMAELRLKTYQEFAWPGLLSNLFRYNGLSVLILSTLSVAAALFFAFVYGGSARVFATHTGADSFYRVVPYLAIILPMTALAVFLAVSIVRGVANFWRETGGKPGELFDLNANLQAIWDTLNLKNLDGDGYGCNYPDDRFRMARRYFHHLVFYGFMSCLASTTIAMFYDHFLGLPAPYPFWSWPVLLGTMGGLALVIGTGGMLYLKVSMDRVPASSQSIGMDVAFTALLFMTTFTGLLLLILRSTPLMGITLSAHLGLVAALFIATPYGKLIHAFYRYAALVRNAVEQDRDKAGQPFTAEISSRQPTANHTTS